MLKDWEILRWKEKEGRGLRVIWIDYSRMEDPIPRRKKRHRITVLISTNLVQSCFLKHSVLNSLCLTHNSNPNQVSRGLSQFLTFFLSWNDFFYLIMDIPSPRTPVSSHLRPHWHVSQHPIDKITLPPSNKSSYPFALCNALRHGKVSSQRLFPLLHFLESHFLQSIVPWCRSIA